MEDLARKRVETTFNVEAMKIIWASNQWAFELHHKLASIVANDPVFWKDNKPNMTHKELFIDDLSLCIGINNMVLVTSIRRNDQLCQSYPCYNIPL
jgi:hypothetical protein